MMEVKKLKICNNSIVEVAKYLASKYYNLYKKNISKIKLQKGLFLLFYEHAKLMSNQLKYLKNNIDLEINVKPISDTMEENYLFKTSEENFEAWAYGPVMRSVYDKHYDIADEKSPYVFENEELNDYMNGIVKDIFSTDDFSLVEVTHTFDAWKSKYNKEDIFHNNYINYEDILEGNNDIQ